MLNVIFQSAVKKTALFVYVAALILGLCGWIWFQSQKISSLEAENQAQAQTIQAQAQVHQQLRQDLEQERLAVESQYLAAQKWRNQVEVAQGEINELLKQDACSNHPLPRGVVDSLKRLHKQNYNSN